MKDFDNPYTCLLKARKGKGNNEFKMNTQRPNMSSMARNIEVMMTSFMTLVQPPGVRRAVTAINHRLENVIVSTSEKPPAS